ncbi:MAG: FecCD family ABC transporter permease, partial [Exiguobacterium acetylicum]
MMESRLRRRQQLTFWTLLALLIATLVVSIGIGPASLSYDRLLPTLLGNGSFKEEFVLYSLRLPRLLITVMAGMALALSGAILQGITRNELADPGIIGINTGAGVAVALFFLYFPTDVGSFIYLLPIAAFLGALVTATAIYLFSYDRVQGLQPIRLILTGVGFSMALSGIMVILISSTRREKVDFIAKWLAGNIWGTDWIFVYSLLPWLLVLIPLTFYKANKLNL